MSGKSNAIAYWTNYKHLGLSPASKLFSSNSFETLGEFYLRLINSPKTKLDLNYYLIFHNLLSKIPEYLNRYFGFVIGISIIFYFLDRKNWTKPFNRIPFLLFFTIMLFTSILYPSPRFILVVIPFLCIFGAFNYIKFTCNIKQWFESRNHNNNATKIYLILMVFITILSLRPFRWISDSPNFYHQLPVIINELKNHDEDGTITVLTNSSCLFHYNGMSNTYFLPQNISDSNLESNFQNIKKPIYIIIENKRETKETLDKSKILDIIPREELFYYDINKITIYRVIK